MAKGSEMAKRRELSVSLFCSRRKQGCSIRDAAKRNASQSRPPPKRRDSAVVGSKVKLKRTTTIKMNTIVVVRSSRERNSVRSSLPSRTEVLESRLMAVAQAFPKIRIECNDAPD